MANTFLKFGENIQATNTIPDAEYSTDAIRNAGHVTGPASSIHVNKTLQNVSAITSAIGGFIDENRGLGSESNDLMSTPELLNAFLRALKNHAPQMMSEVLASQWTISDIPGVSSFFLSCGTYSNGLFALGGYGGLIVTSRDRVNWTVRRPFDSNSRDLTSAASRDGLFVFGDEGGNIITSPDGEVWTVTAGPSNRPVGAIISDGTTFVLAEGVTSDGRIFSSSSPASQTSWVQRTHPIPDPIWASGIYANSLFVLGGTPGSLITSPDAVTWTSRTLPQGAEAPEDVVIRSIAYGNEMFLFGGWGGLFYSADAETWRFVETYDAQYYVSGLVFGNEKFLIFSQGSGVGGLIHASTNGREFSDRSIVGMDPIIFAVYGDGAFVVGGPNLIASSRSWFL